MKKISAAPFVLLCGSLLILSGSVRNANAQQNNYTVEAPLDTASRQENVTVTTLSGKIRRSKTVSEDDLSTLVAVADDMKQNVLLRVQAVKAILGVKPETLTATQHAKIDVLVMDILQEDDKATDPEGYLKMTSAPVASRILRSKRYLPILKQLTTDSRSAARVAAQRTYDNLNR